MNNKATKRKEKVLLQKSVHNKEHENIIYTIENILTIH